ncbi:DoxX family protein [Benzoatithermus flavus]|uniref:DoxX family protein n=1 Tax=Benzoatithermus flavus TaxID=3108223 RepID=A0ABU8XR88_9PROT
MATTTLSTVPGPTGALASLARAYVRFGEAWAAPVLFLTIRIWMAEIFFRSGLLKLADLDAATFLFTDVHPVPLLPPWLAAYLATAIELGCSTLLALGLAARLAALPMLAMALVIQFVVGTSDPSFWATEHFYWMFLLALVACKGAGTLSLDRLLAARGWPLT